MLTIRQRAEKLDRIGRDLITQGRLEEAVDHFQQGMAIDASYPDAQMDLGATLRLLGKRAEAAEALGKALALRPEWPQALYNLGITLLETGDAPQALASLRRAAELQPDWSLALGGVGAACLALGNLTEAKTSLEKAVALDPGLHAAGHALGVTQWACGESDAAISTWRTAGHHNAACHECHLALSLALLTGGEYAAGWEEFEWRWRQGGTTPRLKNIPPPLWDGSPLNGERVLLWAEQGLGDILQFVRFAALVPARGGTVELLSRPNLDRLLATCPGVDHVVSDQKEIGDCAYQLPLASLPRVLGIGVEDLASVPVPYLTPPAGPWSGDPLGPRRGRELRVGLVWAVESGHPNWQGRSCPLPLLRALEDVPEVDLYSLQFGARKADLLRGDGPRIADLSAVLGDFASTAALIDHLDLIITVDTSMAHLAGAIGKPVWTLLPWDADWRWMRHREDSPWYPTMRLFRQQRPGGWDDVVTRVAAALRELAESPGPLLDAGAGPSLEYCRVPDEGDRS